MTKELSCVPFVATTGVPYRPIVRRCGTRPHYGLPGGRGVFCVAHKKKGMIHLLNETNSAKKEEATRCELGRTVIEGNL